MTDTLRASLAKLQKAALAAKDESAKTGQAELDARNEAVAAAQAAGVPVDESQLPAISAFEKSIHYGVVANLLLDADMHLGVIEGL